MSQKILGAAPLGRGQGMATDSATPGGGGGAGSAIDPGLMEHWDIGNSEMPLMGPNGIDSGLMEHWDMGGTEMPPAWTVI